MPFFHHIQVPQHLAEHFSRGNKEKYKSYCRAYFLGNYPELLPIMIDGQPQDVYAQKGMIKAIYRPGMSPPELIARSKDKRG